MTSFKVGDIAEAMARAKKTYISCGQCGDQFDAFGNEGENNSTGAFFCNPCWDICRELNIEPSLGGNSFVECGQCLSKFRPEDGSYDPNSHPTRARPNGQFYCQPCWDEWEEADPTGPTADELADKIDEQLKADRQSKGNGPDGPPGEDKKYQLQTQILQYLGKKKVPIPMEELQLIVNIDFRCFGYSAFDAFVRDIGGVSVRFDAVNMRIVAYLTGFFRPKATFGSGTPDDVSHANQKHAGEVDYYMALDIARDADTDTIKKAYRKKALKVHPDRHQDDKERYEKEFRDLTKMYETLIDKTERHLYDIYLKRTGGANRRPYYSQTRKPGQAGPSKKPTAGFTEVNGQKFATQEDLKEFFQSVDDFLFALLMDIDNPHQSASFKNLSKIVHLLMSFVPSKEQEELEQVDPVKLELELASHWWYSASGATVGPEPLAAILDVFLRRQIGEATYVIDQKQISTWTALKYVPKLWTYLKTKRMLIERHVQEEKAKAAKANATWICDMCKEENGFKRDKCVSCGHDPVNGTAEVSSPGSEASEAERRKHDKKQHKKDRKLHRKQRREQRRKKEEKRKSAREKVKKDKSGKPIIWKPGELPPGWIQFKDDKDRPYYFHKGKNKTTWEHPNPAPVVIRGLWPPPPWRPVWNIERKRFFESGKTGARVPLEKFQKMMQLKNYFIPDPDPEFEWEEYFDMRVKKPRWINRRTNAITVTKPQFGTWPPKAG